MANKTIKFRKDDLGKLPNDKPVIYKILTRQDGNNYTLSVCSL